MSVIKKQVSSTAGEQVRGKIRNGLDCGFVVAPGLTVDLTAIQKIKA